MLFPDLQMSIIWALFFSRVRVHYQIIGGLDLALGLDPDFKIQSGGVKSQAVFLPLKTSAAAQSTGSRIFEIFIFGTLSRNGGKENELRMKYEMQNEILV